MDSFGPCASNVSTTVNECSVLNDSTTVPAIDTKSKSIKLLLKEVPEIGEHFIVYKKVGAGTFSNVFLAVDKTNDKKKLAIKHVLPTSHPSRILQELKCLSTIGGCCNIVGLLQCYRHFGSVAFVMPYFPHDPFSECILDMTVEETRDYIKNLLIALQRVHSFDVLHRDVKPNNFLYNRKNRRYLLVDFGLADFVEQREEKKNLVPYEQDINRSTRKRPVLSHFASAKQNMIKWRKADNNANIIPLRRKSRSFSQNPSISQCCTNGNAFVDKGYVSYSKDVNVLRSYNSELSEVHLNKLNLPLVSSWIVSKRPDFHFDRNSGKQNSAKSRKCHSEMKMNNLHYDSLWCKLNRNNIKKAKRSLQFDSGDENLKSSSNLASLVISEHSYSELQLFDIHMNKLSNLSTNLNCIVRESSAVGSYASSNVHIKFSKCDDTIDINSVPTQRIHALPQQQVASVIDDSVDDSKSTKENLEVCTNSVKSATNEKLLKPTGDEFALSNISNVNTQSPAAELLENKAEEQTCKINHSRRRRLRKRYKCRCDGRARICNKCIVREAMEAPRAGTPGYRPPEVLLKYPHQTAAIDIWAAGVIMLSIMSASYPFFHSREDTVALMELITIFGTDNMRNLARKLGRRLHANHECEPVNLRSLCESLQCRERSKPQTDSHQNSCEFDIHQSTTMDNCTQSLSTTEEYSDMNNKVGINPDQIYPDSAYDLLCKLLDIDQYTRYSATEALKHPFFKES